MATLIVDPPSPTFERGELFPRLRRAYVSNDEEDDVTRARLRRIHSAQHLRPTSQPLRTSHSAQGLRTAYQKQQQQQHARQASSATSSTPTTPTKASRRRPLHRSAPPTPPRQATKQRYAFTAPSSPTHRSRGRVVSEPPQQRARVSSSSLFGSSLRPDLSRDPSSSSHSSSSRRSSTTSLVGDLLAFGDQGRRALKVPLPDKTKTLARATEAFQFGLIAFGAAVALWSLVGVLFASYGLTALDSMTSSTKWLNDMRPRRRPKTPAVTSETAIGAGPTHPPRPPLSSLVPTLLFTLLVWGGDEAAKATGLRPRSQ